MILTGKEIKRRIGTDILIDPYSEKQLNPNSYNLKLHNKLLVYQEDVLNPKKDNDTIKIEIPTEGLTLQPNKLYLGRTVEYTETNNLVPKIYGRSSLGRLGLWVHITAALGDVGFKGYFTLEFACVQPLVVFPMMEICQIEYSEVVGDITKYNGKYQNNKGIDASKLYKEF